MGRSRRFARQAGLQGVQGGAGVAPGCGAEDFALSKVHGLPVIAPIDEAGLSVRSINSLKNSNIRTLGDLVRNTEDQLLKVRNVGDEPLIVFGDPQVELIEGC